MVSVRRTSTSSVPHSGVHFRFGSVGVESRTVNFRTRLANSMYTGSECGTMKLVKSTTCASNGTASTSRGSRCVNTSVLMFKPSLYGRDNGTVWPVKCRVGRGAVGQELVVNPGIGLVHAVAQANPAPSRYFWISVLSLLRPLTPLGASEVVIPLELDAGDVLDDVDQPVDRDQFAASRD